MKKFLISAKKQLFPRRRVRVGRWEILSTPNHPLNEYQIAFPFYDQFLPILCSHLGGTAIDIGANIGDSTAAILATSSHLRIVAVEPDDAFYAILKHNCERIDIDRRVELVKAFVSSTKRHFVVCKSSFKSTGHVSNVASEKATSPTLSFAELIIRTGAKDISIIKSDTDGFDWDVLASIGEYLKIAKPQLPLIFFEMQTYLQELGFNDEDRPNRIRLYLDSISDLFALGYEEFLLLDNFGVPILRGHDVSLVEQVERYLESSQTLGKRVPAFYIDIALFCRHHTEVIEKSLAELRQATK